MTSHNNSHNSTKWANNSLILPLFKQPKRSHSDAQKSLKYERKSFGDISNVTNFCLPGFKPRLLWKIYICSLINQKRFWHITLVYSNRIFVFFYYLCRIGLSMFCADGSVASLQSLSCVEQGLELFCPDGSVASLHSLSCVEYCLELFCADVTVASQQSTSCVE